MPGLFEGQCSVSVCLHYVVFWVLFCLLMSYLLYPRKGQDYLKANCLFTFWKTYSFSVCPYYTVSRVLFCLCTFFMQHSREKKQGDHDLTSENLWACAYYNVILASDSDNDVLNSAFRFRVTIMRLLQIWCRQAFFFLSPWMVQCPSPLHMYLCNGFSALNFSPLQSIWIGQSTCFTLDHPLFVPCLFSLLVLHARNSFYSPRFTHMPSSAAPYILFSVSLLSFLQFSILGLLMTDTCTCRLWLDHFLSF